MENSTQGSKDDSLRFFGKIVASISHEIKNVMAIINEKAGLIKDLTLMAEKGVALDPAKIQALAEGLNIQIKRGDAIIKDMNKFAHSVDKDSYQVDLCELTALMVRLAERFALRLSVTLDLKFPETTLKINTHPFILESLIWDCLFFAMETSAKNQTVNITINKPGDTAELRFGLTGNRFTDPLQSFPGDSTKMFMKKLQANVLIDSETGELVLGLPEDLQL